MFNTYPPSQGWWVQRGTLVTWQPACHCYLEPLTTSGEFWCPMHGEMRKLPNGEVEKVKRIVLV